MGLVTHTFCPITQQKNNTKLKQFVQTKGPVKVDFVEVIPGAFKAVIRDKSINPKSFQLKMKLH